jgi:hypothetical protein
MRSDVTMRLGFQSADEAGGVQSFSNLSCIADLAMLHAPAPLKNSHCISLFEVHLIVCC